MLKNDNQLCKGAGHLIDLDRDRLVEVEYQKQLEEAVRQTVTTIAWMLRGRAEAKTTS